MFRLGTLLFIPGYITVTFYRVLVGPDSGGTLLLMIRGFFSRYFRRSILLTRPFLTQSLDNQHVSGLKSSSYRSLIRTFQCCAVLWRDLYVHVGVDSFELQYAI